MSKRSRALKAYKAAIDNLEEVMGDIENLTFENQGWVASKLKDYKSKFDRLAEREDALRLKDPNYLPF